MGAIHSIDLFAARVFVGQCHCCSIVQLSVCVSLRANAQRNSFLSFFFYVFLVTRWKLRNSLRFQRIMRLLLCPSLCF